MMFKMSFVHGLAHKFRVTCSSMKYTDIHADRAKAKSFPGVGVEQYG